MGQEVKLDSTVRCPNCGFKSTERMPTDFCLVRYECPMCGYIMTPKMGSCCVFCSYGDVPCPSVQAERSSRTSDQ